MFIDIDPSNGVPIYDQVCRQIKFAVAKGYLSSGDRVPSVRELAKELVINPNTIVRAYQLLQQESIIESIRGVGFQVCNGALAICIAGRRKLIQERLEGVLSEAIQSGLSDKEVDELYRGAVSEIKREKP